jgi:predicted ATPase
LPRQDNPSGRTARWDSSSPVAHGLCREIAPSYLSEAAIERYIALQFSEHAFPPGFAGLIHDRTEGNPLFMADVLRDLRRRHVIEQQDGRWAIARELPESVRSLIQRKMDALERVRLLP